MIAVVTQTEDLDGRVVLSLRRVRNRTYRSHHRKARGADGLVPRSEISWEKGVEPTTRHRIGDAVKFMVVGLDRDRQRNSLTIKRLSADPWERYMDQLETGQVVDATVTRVMPYGAFARVAAGVEGLIHISEIASERVTDPNQAVRIGQVLPVRIVAIDRERRRLSLSARLSQST